VPHAARSEIADAVAGLVRAIDYSNFKNEVAARQGKHRADRYGRVWSTLYDLEESGARAATLRA
jgi:hypothetical protein